MPYTDIFSLTHDAPPVDNFSCHVSVYKPHLARRLAIAPRVLAGTPETLLWSSIRFDSYGGERMTRPREGAGGLCRSRESLSLGAALAVPAATAHERRQKRKKAKSKYGPGCQSADLEFTFNASLHRVNTLLRRGNMSIDFPLQVER
ncbi:hypothetical protein NDU88_005531 [Pleurodeles waltl]|uniref:Uncharacterized protein n=1 Tax=Pleurodeles waltl TaxID=8319 RepID=A0AAV7QFJ0_PLEWA|nr:hypothetical protein NDU88_005531 [Pleurodeles waltl]